MAYGVNHPAWREAIIPFLKQQPMIDQLWCCSPYFHNTILSKVTHLTCYVRPQDLPTKKQGIYPSYIGRMTNLRSLFVTLYPRIKEMWESSSEKLVSPHAIFRENLPLTINWFECDCWIFSTLPGSQADSVEMGHLIFSWLERFSNITIGDHIKSSLAKVFTPDYLVALQSPPAYLKFQFITAINVIQYTQLVSLMQRYQFHDLIGLITIFSQGIKSLITADSDPQVLTISWGQETPQQTYQLLYQFLPNLEEIQGPVPVLPDKLLRYYMKVSDISLPYVHLLQVLSVPWRAITVSLLKSLTELKSLTLLADLNLTVTLLTNPNLIITVEHFSNLIDALPKSLRSLAVDRIFPNVSDYWTIDIVASLPRGLLTLQAYGTTRFDTEKIKVLPPHLEELRDFPIQHMISYITSKAVLLPPTLRSISIVGSDTSDIRKMTSLFQHFTQLRTLEINSSVRISTEIEWILPNTLENFTLVLRDKVVIPFYLNRWFRKITWPSSLTSINITATIHGSTNLSSEWYLPESLEKLSITGVVISNLPYRWPAKLRLIEFTNVTTNDFVINEPFTEWPDIDRMKYYLPDPRWCSIISGVNKKYTMKIGHDGRPTIKLLD